MGAKKVVVEEAKKRRMGMTLIMRKNMTVMMGIIRRKGEEGEKVRAKGKAKLFLSLKSNLVEGRRKEVTVRRKKKPREIRMKSSKTCLLRRKTLWGLKMYR